MTKDHITTLVKELRAKKGVEVLVKGSKGHAPQSLSYNDSRKSFTPDVVAIYAKKKHDFYAFEKNITNATLPELIGKWILFALHARLKSGQFFLVVDGEKNGKRCQAIIDRKQLGVELIIIK